jgi:hypothetical protein
MRGTTDLILVESHSVDCLVIEAGIRAVIELKKTIKSSHIKQVIFKMMAADLFVRDEIKVFGLLTDLKSVWHFFWLEEGRKIMTVKMTHRNKALDFASELADVYREQSKEVNIIGLQKVRRVKIRELFDDLLNDDIAPMEDFYEEMDDNERRRHEAKKVINLFKNTPMFASYFNDHYCKQGQDDNDGSSIENSSSGDSSEDDNDNEGKVERSKVSTRKGKTKVI